MNPETVLEKLQQAYKSCTYFNKSIISSFHSACTDLNFDLIDLLIALGIDNKEYIRAFDAMCHVKNLKGAEQLFQKFNIQDKNSLIKLFNLACEMGDIDIVNMLITEKKSKYHIESITPFYLACESNHIDVAKLLFANGALVYDDCGIVSAFVVAAGHTDSTMLNFLLDCELDIAASLRCAVIQATKFRSIDNVLKIIDLGANVSDIRDFFHIANETDLLKIFNHVTTSENYLAMYDLLCKGHELYRINILTLVLQKYATSEDVPVLCKWLKKIDKKHRLSISSHYVFLKLVLEKNNKFFIDAFYDVAYDYMHSNVFYEFLKYTELSDLQVYVLCDKNIDCKKITQDETPDEFILYVLFKRNDIRSFIVLQKMYPGIKFEIDDCGNLSSYQYCKCPIKSARNNQNCL